MKLNLNSIQIITLMKLIKTINTKTMKHFSFKLSRRIFPVIIATLFSIFFISCGSKSDTSGETKTTTENKGADTSAAEIAKEVEISQKQYTAINIQLGSFEQKNLANVLKATGNLSVPPQSKATITSPLGGTIKTINVQEGDNIKQGQVLATIINPEFVKMKQDYLETQAQLTLAKANYLRQQELAKENVSAQRILQEATSNYRSLEAKVSSLQSQFNLLGISASSISTENMSSVIIIRSPINGNVAKVNVNLGLTVEPSTTLMQIVDNSHLHLDLFVYEQDLPKVNVGQNVDFTLINLPGKNFTAKVYSIGSAFENETKTIPIHAEIKGHIKELIEGMNVIGLINIGDNLTTAVLSNAVVSFGGSDYIFIQKLDSAHVGSQVKDAETSFKFERIRVKKGITSGGYTEVTALEEIPANIKVVTSGAFYLMAILTNGGEEE